MRHLLASICVFLALAFALSAYAPVVEATSQEKISAFSRLYLTPLEATDSCMDRCVETHTICKKTCDGDDDCIRICNKALNNCIIECIAQN